MRRFLRVRLVLVLFALVLAPAAVLPFAERLRSEWTKFWEPEPKEPDWVILLDEEPLVFTNAIYVCPTDWSNVPAAGNLLESIPDIVVPPLDPNPTDGESDPQEGSSP